MKLDVMRILPVVVLLLTGTACAEEPPARGFADAVLGRWDLTIKGPDGDYPSWVEIRLRKESELMAEFVGQFGSKRHASAVSFADDRLEMRIPVQWEKGDDGELIFEGMLERGNLSGHARIDNGERYEWTGVRAPLLAHTDKIEWGDPVTLIGDDMSGWRRRFADHAGCWDLASGILSATPPCVDLVSEARFDDFRLKLEFRYPPGSNTAC